jgi:hypothetical protein
MMIPRGDQNLWECLCVFLVPVRFFLDFPAAVGGECTGTFGLLESITKIES